MTTSTAQQWEQARQRVGNVIEGSSTDIDRLIADVAQHDRLSPGLLAEYPGLVDSGRAWLVETVVRYALGWAYRTDEEGNRAGVVYDYPNDRLIGTVLETGQTFTANDSEQLAGWLFAAGVRRGLVTMPHHSVDGDIAPPTGSKVALHHHLNELGKQASGEHE